MKVCEKLPDCPFFKKYSMYATSYIFVYCEGPKLESCARLLYKNTHGVKPPDELTPTGILVDPDE